MYVLKLPSGTLVPDTFSMTKSECWGKSFPWVALSEGAEWRERFYKRWEHSLKSARKLGYRMVKVKLVEVE